VVTKIFSEGFPQPHKFAESFCCNTMPEEIIAGNLNWASDREERIKRIIANSERHLILVQVCGL
jgi:hypothetical protein